MTGVFFLAGYLSYELTREWNLFARGSEISLDMENKPFQNQLVEWNELISWLWSLVDWS